MSTQDPLTIDFLKKAVSDAIDKGVSREFDTLAKKLLEDLQRRKNEICAGVLLDITKLIEFQSLGDRLVVTIREIKK